MSDGRKRTRSEKTWGCNPGIGHPSCLRVKQKYLASPHDRAGVLGGECQGLEGLVRNMRSPAPDTHNATPWRWTSSRRQRSWPPHGAGYPSHV